MHTIEDHYTNDKETQSVIRIQFENNNYFDITVIEEKGLSPTLEIRKASFSLSDSITIIPIVGNVIKVI